MSAPQVNMGNKPYSLHVAQVVGGGSVVNGMAFDRASAADYDSWEALGNPGWNWESMLKYFRKSTTFTPPSPEHAAEFNITYDSKYYGTNGPIQVSYPKVEYQDQKKVWKSWYAENITFPREHASGDAVGAYWIPNNIDPKEVRRSHARLAYYDPVSSRPNLKLLTGQTVNQILLEGKGKNLKAVGIQFVDRTTGEVQQARASREVILSAGGIFTPHLMQLSGLGPKTVLEAAGIPVKKDIPGVGSNLQDHPTISLRYNISNLAFPNPTSLQTNATFNATSRAEYLANKTGFYGYAQRNTLAFLSLPQITPSKFRNLVSGLLSQNAVSFLPDIYKSTPALVRGFLAQRKVLANDFLTNKLAIGEMPLAYTGTALSALQKPLSRGTVTLDPKNLQTPVIQFQALQNPFDLDILLEMVSWQRRHWSSPLLSSYAPVEIMPGAQVTDPKEIFNRIVENGGVAPSFAHPSCTCAMMPEELGGVVDSELRVYGVKGLRIVDASVMPVIVAAHLQSTVYAVAEKGADIIRGRK